MLKNHRRCRRSQRVEYAAGTRMDVDFDAAEIAGLIAQVDIA